MFLAADCDRLAAKCLRGVTKLFWFCSSMSRRVLLSFLASRPPHELTTFAFDLMIFFTISRHRIQSMYLHFVVLQNVCSQMCALFVQNILHSRRTHNFIRAIQRMEDEALCSQVRMVANLCLARQNAEQGLSIFDTQLSILDVGIVGRIMLV